MTTPATSAYSRWKSKRFRRRQASQLSSQAGCRAKYTYLGAEYTSEQNTACLYFNYGQGNLPVLAIAERPAAGPLDLNDITISTVDIGDGKIITLPIVPETVEVGGADGGQGTLITNGVNAGNLCPQKDLSANQALYWQSGGMDYVIFGMLDQMQGGVFISRLEMQHLAENLTGVATLPDDEIDPRKIRDPGRRQHPGRLQLESAYPNDSREPV